MNQIHSNDLCLANIKRDLILKKVLKEIDELVLNIYSTFIDNMMLFVYIIQDLNLIILGLEALLL